MTWLLQHLLATPAWVALLVVFLVPALESSAFVGLIFPGEAAILLGGVVASQGHAPLAGVLAAGIAGAVAGDSVGYLVGRRWGRRMLDSTMGRSVKAEHLDRGEATLRRRGSWAVFLGRFTAALRVMIPGLAGMARMPYRRFAIANITGGILWGTTMAMTGYLAGNSWHTVERYISTGGGVAAVVVVALLLVARAVRRRRARRSATTDEPSADASGEQHASRAGPPPAYAGSRGISVEL